MAIKNFLFELNDSPVPNLTNQLAPGANPTVQGTQNIIVVVTVDDSHQEDLDQTMALHGFSNIGDTTTLPTQPRHFGTLAADPDGVTHPGVSFNQGDMYYNSGSNALKFYTGVVFA